jgi:mRNA-degrading endonuclease RelE of RelBE toxin-antitoxin system
MKIRFVKKFEKKFSKLKNNELQIKIIKQIEKIKEDPLIGKPMKYERKGTREVYVNSFRLAYAWNKEELIILMLDIYHKDEQ